MKLSNNRVEEVEVINEKLLPPTVDKDGGTNSGLALSLTRFLQARANISTPVIKDVKSFVNLKIFDNAGKVSLFDSYWVKQKNEETWESVNPYDNWDSKNDPLVKLHGDPVYFDKQNIINSPNFAIPKNAQNSFFYRQGDKIFKFDKNIFKIMSFSKQNLENPIVKRRQCVIVNENLFAASLIDTSKDVECFSLLDVFNAKNPQKDETMENVVATLVDLGLNKEYVLNFFNEVVKADENVNNEDRDLDSIYLKRDTSTLEYIGFCDL